MSSEDFGIQDDEGEEWTPRPIVFPTVEIPVQVMYVTAAALVGAAGLAVIAALIRASSFSEPAPQGISGLDISQPSLSLADRASIFTSSGGGIVVSIMIALAVALLAIADRNQYPTDRVGRTVLVVASVVAGVIVAANTIMFVDVLANTSGIFLAAERANAASSAVGHLEPILVALGAGWYSAARLKAGWEENGTDQALDETGPQ